MSDTMSLRRSRRIVLLGMVTKMPVPGVLWQTLHYMVGFRRLGYDVVYVEAHSRTPSMFTLDGGDPGSKRVRLVTKTGQVLGEDVQLHRAPEAEDRRAGQPRALHACLCQGSAKDLDHLRFLFGGRPRRHANRERCGVFASGGPGGATDRRRPGDRRPTSHCLTRLQPIPKRLIET